MTKIEHGKFKLGDIGHIWSTQIIVSKIFPKLPCPHSSNGVAVFRHIPSPIVFIISKIKSFFNPPRMYDGQIAYKKTERIEENIVVFNRGKNWTCCDDGKTICYDGDERMQRHCGFRYDKNFFTGITEDGLVKPCCFKKDYTFLKEPDKKILLSRLSKCRNARVRDELKKIYRKIQ